MRVAYPSWLSLLARFPLFFLSVDPAYRCFGARASELVLAGCVSLFLSPPLWVCCLLPADGSVDFGFWSGCYLAVWFFMVVLRSWRCLGLVFGVVVPGVGSSVC